MNPSNSNIDTQPQQQHPTGRIVASSRMGRRASTGMTGPVKPQVPQNNGHRIPRRTKARRQSGDAVNNMDADLFFKKTSNLIPSNRCRSFSDDSDYNRPINLLLDRNDSIKLIKQNMDEYMEDHSDRYAFQGRNNGNGNMDASLNDSSLGMDSSSGRRRGNDSGSYLGDSSSSNCRFGDSYNAPNAMMDVSAVSCETTDSQGRVIRYRRRKPRRQSGDEVPRSRSTLEEIKSNMPQLLTLQGLDEENSVHHIEKRLPSRRASLTF